MLRVYDTSGMAAPEQFAYWREELCHNFVEMAPERLAKIDNFRGRISQQSLSDISISRVAAEGHTVNRTKYEISRSFEDCYFANLQLTGTGITQQRGTEIVSRKGDLVLVNASEPYSIIHDSPFDLISVKVPHNLLASRLELRRSRSVPHIPLERGYGTVLRSYTMSILDELDTDFIGSAAFLAENLVSLIASALNATDIGPRATRLGQQQYARLQAILGYVRLHLSDQELGLVTVADHFGLSPRYVQKLFSATGNTFSKTVLYWRLDRVAAAMRSPELAGRTLTEIAFSWGFNDFSYFSRTFKTRFTLTAREYRSRQGGARSSPFAK